MKLLSLGAVEVYRVEEFLWEVSPRFLFTEFTDADLARHGDLLLPRFFTAEGRMRLSIQAFVVKTPHHTLLLDACVGNAKERPGVEAFHRRDTDFLGRLRRDAGITPEQVDYVFCTHFHVDHVGWNTRLVDGRWEPTFPNARYLFHRPEFEHFVTQGNGSYEGPVADSVIPIVEANLHEVVDGDHAIGDHLRLEPTPGHTPGHCSVRLETGAGQAVITGDMIHTPLQVREPDWCPRVDHDPAQALATRRAFLERHAEAGTHVLGTHFALPTTCTIAREGEAYRPVFPG